MAELGFGKFPSNTITLGNTFEHFLVRLNEISRFCELYRVISTGLRVKWMGLVGSQLRNPPWQINTIKKCSFCGVYAWILVESMASWVFRIHFLKGKGVWVPASPRCAVSKCQGSCLAMAHSHGGNRFWNADPKSPFGQALHGRISKFHEIEQNHFGRDLWRLLKFSSWKFVQAVRDSSSYFWSRIKLMDWEYTVDPKITQNPCLQRRPGTWTFIFSCASSPFKGAARIQVMPSQRLKEMLEQTTSPRSHCLVWIQRTEKSRSFHQIPWDAHYLLQESTLNDPKGRQVSKAQSAILGDPSIWAWSTAYGLRKQG